MALRWMQDRMPRAANAATVVAVTTDAVSRVKIVKTPVIRRQLSSLPTSMGTPQPTATCRTIQLINQVSRVNNASAAAVTDMAATAVSEATALSATKMVLKSPLFLQIRYQISL